MPINVLVVDDSNFFQHRLAEIIEDHPDLHVIGVASNGREAVEMARSKDPDVITMDYEMPLMDGVSAVRAIMASKPVPILMLSSLTYEGARITLDALEAGAVDFLPKNFAEVSRKSPQLKQKLHERLLAIAKPGRRPVAAVAPASKTSAPTLRSTSPAPVSVVRSTTAPITPADKQRYESNQPAPVADKRPVDSLLGRIKLLAIGTSTGGPVALVESLKSLPANFPVPILLIQHMPENFTRAFAERLNSQCNIRVHLAEDGMRLAPGVAYLAPGGQQMILDSKDKNRIKVLAGDDRLNYKPSVDITFASAANAFQSNLLAMVLTGMGSDGCQGCRLVKEFGGVVWSQDQASSVIYGMPMAVARANLTDRVLALCDIAPTLRQAFRC
ncbi:chemotaxis response regulator protein-glutamate methylesterase [Halioxenophilus sp. WMMB6]|uniref:protein-glutamate methylesterase/protein-glutamine glutaminase n=1 Tax=Halioxenophilus sp. WMMB6 TaxID=3073815 RepID=UPI00295F0241|nr:chemotaxis response regulator protein-glutamate methylesterase [Halioxenophilus sp. WMMB6]